MAGQNGRTPPNAEDVADESQADRAIVKGQLFYHEMAEATLLAALLWNSPSVPDDLDPAIFYRDQHQALADHVMVMRANGHEPNMVGLIDDLGEHDKLERAGGSVYITHLYNLRPMSTETQGALRVVERNYYRRRAEEARYDVLKFTASGRPIDEITRALQEVRYWEELKCGAAAEARPTRFRFLSVKEMDGMKPDKGLLGDVLYENSLACLYGPSGRWKSFIVLDWALCIACGVDWLGRSTKRGRVVYVAAEGSGGVRKRRRAWAQRHREVSDYTLFQLVPQPVNLMDPEQVRDFIEDTKAQGDIPALIIFDTLARCMAGGNFNDPKDANIITDSLGQIKMAFPGVCVLTVAHTGKDVSRGIVGAIQFYNNMDTVIAVNGKEGQERIEPSETVKLVNEKPKENDGFTDIILTTELVRWPLDEHGDEWESSLVVLGVGAESRRPGPVKLPASSVTALTSIAAFIEGARTNAWWHASGLKKPTFMQYAKPDLVARGFVIEADGVFRATDAGRQHLNGSPAGKLVPFRPSN